MKTVINITSVSFAVIQSLREGCWADVKDKLAADGRGLTQMGQKSKIYPRVSACISG